MTRDAEPTPTRVLLVGSSGGHLAQLFALKPWWSRLDRRWVTFDDVGARSMLSGETVAWGHFPTTRNLGNLARNTVLARKLLADYRPDLIMSTGAGLAVPFFWLAPRYDARTVYLEVVDRIDSATLTGDLVYPVADEFLVQWDDQAEIYPGARVVGPVI